MNLAGGHRVPPLSSIAVDIRNAVKRFGDTTAISGLSLQIRGGEYFALLGPAAGGKTTLLYLLAGFERPDEGSVLLNGEEVGSLPPQARR